MQEAKRRKRTILACTAITALQCLWGHTTVAADAMPTGWQAHNMAPIGFSAMGGNENPFKLAIKRVGERWYLYASHQNAPGGVSILDVTNPADMRFIRFMPGPNRNTRASQVALHGDLMVIGLAPTVSQEQMGGEVGPASSQVQKRSPDDKPFMEGALFYDISDPENPRLLSHWDNRAAGTHRNSYPGGKYAYMTTTLPEYRGFILVILDVSDPRNPKEVSRWSYPGQKAQEPVGSVIPSLHGPANVSPDGKTISIGYTPAYVNLDITDISQPKLIGQLVLTPPFQDTGAQSIHSALPIWDRDLVVVMSEARAAQCRDRGVGLFGIIDNKDRQKPFLMSEFPVPVPPKGLPYASFCDKGGRFGPHNVPQEIHSPDVERPGTVLYVAYFNAGLRAYDIADARTPVESGWFVPPNPPKPMRAQGGTFSVNQTQDVLVDARGNIFISESSAGVWALKYEGSRRPWIQPAR